MKSSAVGEQNPAGPACARDERRLPSPGQSYLARLGILYMEQIRLTIVTELYMREMGVREFYEKVGGTSWDSVRRHFLKLVEYGWLRHVRTVPAEGQGRPLALYRSTELAVIDTETWSTIPRSIRDAFTVQLLEEMSGRLGEALERGVADTPAGRISAFRTFEVDELGWSKAHDSVERCFRTLNLEQTNAKIRLEKSSEQPRLLVVNLAAFEAPGQAPDGPPHLPRAIDTPSSPWPQRVGKVFADRLDLEIVEELNRADLSPAQLRAKLGGDDVQNYLRRCRRLADLGWAVNTETETGGPLRGASVHRFRAATPSVSESDIYEQTPAPLRKGPIWETFQPFIETSIAAVGAGTFNNRVDRHLTMSPLLIDEIGWDRVTRALRELGGALNSVEAEVAWRRSHRGFTSFQGAFHVLGFEAPRREIRR